MIEARTTAVDQTRAMAGALARLVREGDVVVLSGELGAGKTAFVQGVGAGLGVTDRITSPTFTIAQEYRGTDVVVHHLDVYRLSHLNEALDIGLGEIVDDGAVVLIEWGDAVTPVLPSDFLEVRITFGEGDDDRRFELRPVGDRWRARSRALLDLLGPWGAAGGDEPC